MNDPQHDTRRINSLLAVGLGAVLSGPLWRPDLVRGAGLWLNARGVVLPWQRSCPVPQAEARR